MAKTNKTTAPTGDPFQDIPHEEVKSNGELTQIPRVMTPEETAQQEIKKFNLADSAIAALKDKYGGLKISGPEDKEGYKSVREAWGEVRTIRTGLTKKGKELRDGYNLIAKKIIKEEDRLVELITPLEDELYKTWKAIDEEKERAENERKAAEERGFMERLETLQKFGLVLDGGFYSIGESIQLDAATLRSMPEERFLTLRGKAEAIFQEVELKKENERNEKQRQADEFAKQQKELWAQQEKMKADREELDRQRQEAEKQILESRVNKFLGLGMKMSGGQLYLSEPMGGEISVAVDSLKLYSAEKFQAFFDEITGQIKELKDLGSKREAELEAAAKERERREKHIAEVMQLAGLTYNYSKKAFEFQQSSAPGLNGLHITASWEYLLKMSDEEIGIEANVYTEQIANAKKELSDWKKAVEAQAEAERKAGMKDEEIFRELKLQVLGSVADFDFERFKSKAVLKKAQSLTREVVAIVNKF